jgi:DNA repair protein RadC
VPKERLFQLPLDGGLPLDVTPKDFRGLRYRIETVEVARRFVREVPREYTIRSPADAATHLLQEVYQPFEAFEQEELCVLLLNTKNRLTHEVMLYRGTTNSALVRVAEVFREAVRHNAVAIVVAHNHPSGDPEPSPEDIRITSDIRKSGELLEIQLLDHIVVGRERWVSLKERGAGF